MKVSVVVGLVAMVAAGGLAVADEAVVDAVDVQVIMPAPNGVQAKAEAIVNPATGAVSEIRIFEPGSGYGFTPRIVIAPPPGGMGATPLLAPPTMREGRIASVSVIHGGSGYRSGCVPEVWIEPPNRQAVGRAVLSEDTLAEIEIIDPGSGYVRPGRSHNPILGIHSHSGGTRLYINEVGQDGFAPGHVVRAVDAEGKETGRGLVNRGVSRFAQVAPPGSDYMMINLERGWGEGVFGKGSHIEFVGYSVRFHPARQATAIISGNSIVNFGLGGGGDRIPVEKGEGFVTLRGLPAPREHRAAVRALGYSRPGDGGGGLFFWNPERRFAMPRRVAIRKGGKDYRPGDVLLLNNAQRFLVTEIQKAASDRYPAGLYPDFIGGAMSGHVDVGAVKQLVPLEYRNYEVVPREEKWSNSKAAWSESPGMVVAGWDPKSGRLDIAGGGQEKNARLEVVFNQRDTIRGVKSGAAGTVGSFVARPDGFSMILIKNTVSGVFQAGEALMTVDGPGSGQPFVKGNEDLDIEVVWALDNGGSLVNPSNHEGNGRWERLYESGVNDIRCFGAIGDAPDFQPLDGVTPGGTDNTWPIQMAIVSSGTGNDPGSGKAVFIAEGNYLTGALNNSYAVSMTGGGRGGRLVGQPGQDVIRQVLAPIDMTLRGGLGGTVFEGFGITVNETVNPTGTGGIADRNSYKARRLYKAPRWSRQRNSQRWGSLTFMEAERVSDRRYFGTDDGLDPELAPPINDVEPARRIYYILADREYADRVVSLEVDPTHRGYARRGKNLTLEGGAPVAGSRVGPGPAGAPENFGHVDAGKAVVQVESLFVPQPLAATYNSDSRQFEPTGPAGRIPLLENHRYSFTIAGLLDAKGKPLEFDTICVRDPRTGSLALRLSDKTAAITVETGRGGAVAWIGGPVDKVRLTGPGSYQYRPGEVGVQGLRSDAITDWNGADADGVRLYFGGVPQADRGFRVGMCVRGEKSGAAGVISAFGNDGDREYMRLERRNRRAFMKDESVVPAFNSPARLGSYAQGLIELSEREPVATLFEVVFASENPVTRPLTVGVSRSGDRHDTISLAAGGGAPDGKEYYPSRLVEVKSTGEEKTLYVPYLDFMPTVDARGQRIVLQWDGDWPGKSPAARSPRGNYEVALLYHAGSPTFENLPWPEWRAVDVKDGNWSFHDPYFLGARGGRMVRKGADGLAVGEPLIEGRDYAVAFDAERNTGRVAWKTTAPSAGTFYIQYRKAMDNYDDEPWGSPKHLSRNVQGAVLVDSFERFMGNFGFIQHTPHFPGYPPALTGGAHTAAFRNLTVAAFGGSTSGGITLGGNYNGIYRDLHLRDVNYGLVIPIGLYFPWQDNSVRADGSVMRRVPFAEGYADFDNVWWGNDLGAVQRRASVFNNKYQLLYAYGGGNEQSVFTGFQNRCGDIGIFVQGAAFYAVQDIWASGANATDVPRGSVMFFGKPACGPEHWSNLVQFGPLERMFSEQALNGDYALPVIRCCATGSSGQGVKFQSTQGRQVLWGGETIVSGAGGRSTIFLDRGWRYGMGVWGPQSLRISTTTGEKAFAIDAVGFGADGETVVPLRHGATYYAVIQSPDLGGEAGGAPFVYDAKLPLAAQLLSSPAKATVSNHSVRIHNTNIVKSDFNAVEQAKINRHYGWSLMLCGGDNEVRVGREALRDRERLILEGGGRNKITAGPFDE
jgi:hypothetical protein